MILNSEARWRHWCLFGWITAAGLLVTLLVVTAVLSRSAATANRTADEAQAMAGDRLIELAGLRILTDTQRPIIRSYEHAIDERLEALKADYRSLALEVDQELPALRHQLAASQAANVKLTAEMNALLRAEHLKRLGMAPDDPSTTQRSLR